MKASLVAGYALVLALAALLGACISGEEQCAEVATERECLLEEGCAWGTDASGPHCFYVGDVELQ